MSMDPLSVVRAFADAWNSGDWDAALELCHPEIVWRVTVPVFDVPQLSNGREETRAFWVRWTEQWEHMHGEVEELIARDDEVLLLGVWRAVGRDGVEVNHPVAFVLSLKDGRITSSDAYWERAEGLAAFGLPAGG